MSNSKAESPIASVAYLFPGQGSQSVGMGRSLYEESPGARRVFHEVDMALGRPLAKLVFGGPQDALQETINAQPAIMAVSLACVTAMQEKMDDIELPQPTLMAGHSLGEYTALAAAGVLSVGDAARLVQERGRLMQEACDQRPGGMAAVLGLDRMTIEEIARGTGTYVSNVNTPGQIVISGEHMLVAQALDMCLSRGAKKVIPLRVGGAFHSALMEPARAGLVEAVGKLDFSDPKVPIVGNCTGEPLTKAGEVKEELVKQITSCVEWEQTIEYMVGSGVSRFVEIGPGKALSGMVKRIDGSAEAVAVGDVDSILKLSMN